MKYCSHCGSELTDDASYCSKCGFATDAKISDSKEKQSNELKQLAEIFMIVGTIVNGIAILPLAWCIPMTVSYCNKIKNREPISLALKICSLIFVSTIAGVLMLVDNDD